MDRKLKKMMRNSKLFITDSSILESITDEYLKHMEKVKAMKTNKKITHLDTGMKSCAVGLLTYIGMKQGWSTELVAALVPVVAVALSLVSTKIGDKNTTLMLKMVSDAIEKDEK